MNNKRTMEFERRSAATLKRLRLIVRDLEHPIKQLIMDRLRTEGEQYVSQILDHLLQYYPKISQPEVSSFLGQLRRSKLVKTRRGGKFVYYSRNEETIQRMARVFDIIELKSNI